MALNRVWIPSPNYSARNASVRLIVIHSSEGARTYQSLGNFFANPSSGVSSHVGIDDTPNVVGEYVNRNNKAWTAANANPVATQAELCTPSGASATWTAAVWTSHPVMLANLAQWIREEAAYFNIPIVRLSPSQAQTNGRGVCQHLDLGAWGGGHVDCGPGFPIDAVIAQAAGSAPPTPPTPTPEEPDVLAAPVSFILNGNQQAFWIDDKGNLAHCYARPGSPWVKENLGGGWNVDTALSVGFSTANPGSSDRVFGVRANGARAQCYWTGSAWVTQNLP